MKAREEVQIFSLSFLDLICCAMAGVIVLYVTAPKPEREARRTRPTLIRVDLKCSNKPPPVSFCVRLNNGGLPTEGYSANPKGDWTFEEDGVAELLLEESLAESDVTLDVWVVNCDWAQWDPSKHAKIGVALTCVEMPGEDLSQPPETLHVGGNDHVTFKIR